MALFTGIKNKVRQTVKGSGVFYPFFGKNIRQGIASLPSRDTRIVVEGFQRSGNTFAYCLVSELFSAHQMTERRIAHHTHSVASIKRAIKFQSPSLFLVRDPRDAIISAALYKSAFDVSVIRKNLIQSLADYIDFNSFLLHSKIGSNQVILDFESLIREPGFALSICIDLLDMKSRLKVDELISLGRDKHKDLARSQLSVHGALRTTLPNSEKKMFEQELSKELESKPCIADFENANKLYQALTTPLKNF